MSEAEQLMESGRDWGSDWECKGDIQYVSGWVREWLRRETGLTNACKRSWTFVWLRHQQASTNRWMNRATWRTRPLRKNNNIKHSHFCNTAPGWAALRSVSFTVCSGMCRAWGSPTNSVWKLSWGNWRHYCSQTGYSRDLCVKAVSSCPGRVANIILMQMARTIKACADIGDRILKDGRASPGEMGLYYSWPTGEFI